MTPRERRLKSLLFGKPDRITFIPGRPRESTLAAWHRQGLPEGVHYYTALLEILGLQPEPQRPMPGLGVSFKMIPEFEEKVLEHRGGHYIVQDWMGAVTEISDHYDYTYIRRAKDFVTRKWHKFPVETRADWEKMAQRYDPGAPGRFPEDFDERCQVLKDREGFLRVHFNGPFWQLREWCGVGDPGLFRSDVAGRMDHVSRSDEYWHERRDVPLSDDFAGVREDPEPEGSDDLSGPGACSMYRF